MRDMSDLARMCRSILRKRPGLWRYEENINQLSPEELDLGGKVSIGKMENRFNAAQSILQYDTVNSKLLWRIKRCKEPHPCKSKFCSRCYGKPLNRNLWRVPGSTFTSDDVVNPVYYAARLNTGQYELVKRTNKLLAPFLGRQIYEIAPFTLKLCILQGGEDYVAIKNFYQKWLRDIFTWAQQIVHPDTALGYRFEWSWTTAGDIKWDLPVKAPGVVDAKDLPKDKLVAMLHVHGLAHFPCEHRCEVGNVLRELFDGKWQVHIATPEPDGLLHPLCDEASELHVEYSSPCSGHSNDNGEDCDCMTPCSSSRGQSLTKKSAKSDEETEFHILDELQSGIAPFASYAVKEHLPQATSRFDRRNRKPSKSLTSAQSGQNSSNQDGGSGCDDSQGLTNAQMVIACHGDAELKRAFHRKRLQFYVKPKAPRTKKTSTKRQMARAKSLRLFRDAAARLIHHPKTTTHSLSPVIFGINTAKISCLVTQNCAPIYKEDTEACFQWPLFYWADALVVLKSSLGTRVLKPP